MGVLDSVSSISGQGVAGATEIAAFAISAIDAHKKQKELDRLRQPFYKVQDEYYQNRNQAAELASGGTPQQELNYMTSEAGRGLGSSLDAIIKSGGGLNDASLLLDQYYRQIGKIGSDSAQQHLNNIQYFHQQNAQIAGEKTKAWAINEYQPYQQKLQELKAAKAQDTQNEFNAAMALAGTATSASSGGQNAGLTKNLLAKSGDGYQSAASRASNSGMDTSYLSDTQGI